MSNIRKLLIDLDGEITMKNIVSYAFLALFLLTSSTVGATDPYKSSREYRGDLFDIKVYDPHSKSYFEMKSGPVNETKN